MGSAGKFCCFLIGALLLWACNDAQVEKMRGNRNSSLSHEARVDELDTDLGLGHLVPATAFSKHTVLVLDSGFDVEHEVFKDKLAATYQVRCVEQKPVGAELTGFETSDKALKAALLAVYREKDTGCRIERGVTFRSSPRFEEMSSKRDSWNEAVRKKTLTKKFLEFDKIKEILSGEKGKYLYHGTATAGLVAYQNPKTSLVFLQDQYFVESNAMDDLSNKRCPTQANVDQWVTAHQDEEVRKAFIEAPLSVYEVNLRNIMKKHSVTLVNYSAGREVRPLLETIYEKLKCGKLKLKEQYKTFALLEREREVFRRKKGFYKDADPLWIQAAGNEGAYLKGVEDSLDCSDHPNNRIVVGSAGISGGTSTFSNSGTCVDIYTLGEKVVVAAPSNFLRIDDGTSYSAPLTVRFLTENTVPSLKPPLMIEFLMKEKDTSGRLQGSKLPQELSYEKREQSIEVYALANAENSDSQIATVPEKRLNMREIRKFMQSTFR
jgi:hypothetical protein